MLRYIQKGTFIPDTPTDIANLGTYKEHIVDLPTLIQSYINQGLITVQSSSAGWSLTGNAGTDYNVNFVGTTDLTPLVLASNSAPLAFLTEGDFVFSTDNIFNHTATNYSSVEANGNSATIGSYDNTNSFTRFGTLSSGFKISKADTGNITDLFTVDRASGYVGIGESNTHPQTPLDVLGNMLVHTDKQTVLRIETDSSDTSLYYWGTQIKDNTNTAFLKLGVTGANYGSSNVGGNTNYDNSHYIESYQRNLIMNTTTDGVTNPKMLFDIDHVSKLEVSYGVTINPGLYNNGSASDKYLQINQLSNEPGFGITLTDPQNKYWGVGMTTGSNLGLSFMTSEVGVFDSVSGIYSFVSDERLKDKIEPLVDEDLLLKLEPKQFIFKSDKKEKKRYGLIAQQVKKIIPEIVIGDENTGNLTVDYTSLIPLLIKQIQILTEQVNALMK